MKNKDKEIKQLLSHVDAINETDIEIPDMGAKIKAIAESFNQQKRITVQTNSIKIWFGRHLRKIAAACMAVILITCAITMPFLFMPDEPVVNKVDWAALYATAIDWGFEGDLDEFVTTLLGEDGDMNDNSIIGLSAYEIYMKYHPDYNGSASNWREDLANGVLSNIPDDKKETMKILYVSSMSNTFFYGFVLALDTAWSSWWNIELNIVETDDIPELSGYNFYIFEHKMPEILPADGVVLLINPDVAPQNSGLVLGDIINGSSAPLTLSAGEPSNIMKNITPEYIEVSRYRTVASYDCYKALMFCGNDPVFLVKDEPNAKIAVFTFSMHYSNLPITVEFPHLMYNIFYHLSPL